MMRRTAILWPALGILLLFGIALAQRAPIALAGPQGQATKSPTDEPTQAPYVFPNPIFIPSPSSKNAPPGMSRSPGPTAPLPTLPPAQPIPVQAGGERTYVVVSGDSAWIIAQKAYGNNYGYMYDLILKANGLTATSKLQIGQVLKIPALPGNEPSAATTSTTPTAISASVTPDRQALTSPTTASSAKNNAANSGSGTPSTSRYELALMALNLLSGILLTGSGVFGFLSYTMYQRARRLEKITMMTRRIRAY